MRLFVILLMTLSGSLAAEPLKVVTTLPDLAEVVREVGGAEVSVTALLQGIEDPHYLEAVPSFVRLVANADLVCFVGLDLEVGYLPKVLSRSANAKVQPGGAGYCDMSASVAPLEKSQGPMDRSMGDVHPQGNPHYYLSPLALAASSEVVLAKLKALRPQKSAAFEQNRVQFVERMQKLVKDMNTQLNEVRGRTVMMEYHKEFTYFFAVYQIKSLGSLEEKPGVPPSAAHLATVATRAKREGVTQVWGDLQSPEKLLRKFSEISGVPSKRMPAMLQVNRDDLNTIDKLQRHLIKSLVESVKVK